MRSIATHSDTKTLADAWRRDADWLDAQYNNRAMVPDFATHLERWARESARVRETQRCELGLAYGDAASQTLDVFPAARPSGAVMVFIHGGYWRALNKSDASFIAPAFTGSGVTVVVPNYSLCPAVSVEAIALEMTQAVRWAWQHAADYGGDRQRITVAGHSAGGQLAAMMLACDWPVVAPDLPQGLVASALSLSGLFDMEPIMHAPFLQNDLRLTPAAVQRLSPARYAAPTGRLRALVGEDESSEFHRQTRLIEAAWGAAHVPVCAAIPGCNHFTILEDMARVGSSTHRVALNALA